MLNDIFKAKKYLYYIGLPNIFFKNKEYEYRQFAENSINDLKMMYNETNSPHIGYHYYYVAVFYHEIVKDFEQALEYAVKFLELVKNEKLIMKKILEKLTKLNPDIIFVENSVSMFAL